MTPLHVVAWDGPTEIADLLIAKGAQIQAQAAGGWTPLHAAAQFNRREMVEFLLAKGADVNAKDSNGQTSLNAANAPAMKALLRQHGAK